MWRVVASWRRACTSARYRPPRDEFGDAHFRRVFVTNRRSGLSKLVIGMALGACVIAARPASAQSTIFNIPSTDTVSAGKGYFEFDYLVQLPAPDSGQFQIFAPRGIVGVTPQLEVGVNVAVTH